MIYWQREYIQNNIALSSYFDNVYRVFDSTKVAICNIYFTKINPDLE